MHSGPPRLILSRDRELHNGIVLHNWADTVRCTPQVIHRSADTLQLPPGKIRVMGAGHSFNGLICSNETVLVLEGCQMDLTEDTLVAHAGCTIEEAQTFLGPRHRMLHGYGSIQSQTLAGGLMTSLHGMHRHTFGSHVVSLTATLANSSSITITGEELKYWLSSMGMLGVVTHVSIRTFPFTSMLCKKQWMPIDKGLSILLGSDGSNGSNGSDHLVSLQGINQYDHFFVHECSNESSAEFSEIRSTSMWTRFAFDNILQPLFIVSNTFEFVYQTQLAHFSSMERVDTVNSWMEFPGFVPWRNSEYSVPLSHCNATIRKLMEAQAHLTHLLVRRLHAEDNLLSFAPVDSCIIDFNAVDTYATASIYEDLEAIIHSHGGHTHWGKYFATSFMVPPEFLRYRTQLDPTHKFMNEYTTALINSQQFHYEVPTVVNRAGGWIFSVVIASIISAVWICCCINKHLVVR
jgi:hypothetical protein